MASAICTSFKVELMQGLHNFTNSTGNAFKVALFTSSYTGSASTTAYSTTNEISGTNYTAGGVTLTNVTPTSSGTTAYIDFNDAQWTTATFTARYALVYNSTNSNRACFIIDFGSDQTVTAGTFTVQWPAADATNAIFRIA